MAHYNQSTRERVADINRGLLVTKSATATSGATTKNIFTVSGGNILVTGLVGVVTTVLGGVTNNVKFISTPTAGTAVDISGNVDCDALEAGGFVGVTGTIGANTVKSNAGAGTFPTTAFVVAPGTIGMATDADTTGAMKWYLTYVPLDVGAYVEAA